MQLYASSAFLSAFATILTLITGILFFTKGGRFGLLNDLSSVFQVISMIPLALYFLLMLRSGSLIYSTLVFILGLSGMLYALYGQSLLVLRKINFNQSLKYIPAGAAIGVWLITINLTASGFNLIPNMHGWLGVLAGFGYILTVTAFLIFGSKHFLFYLGSFITGISYPIWAIWLGSIILL
jgi:hypothetical protein